MALQDILNGTGLAAILGLAGAFLQYVKTRKSRTSKNLDDARVIQGMTLDASKGMQGQLEEAYSQIKRLQEEITTLGVAVDFLRKSMQDAEEEAHQLRMKNQTLEAEVQVLRAKNTPSSGGTA